MQTAFLALLVGFIMYYAVSRILILGVEESLTRYAEQGAQLINTYLDGRISELKSIAANSIVSNSRLPIGERLDELKKQLELDTYKRLSIADTQGNSETTDGIKLKIADREYFKKALKGMPNVSEPLISRADASMVIAFATPIIDGDEITGVLYATYDADVLSLMTDRIKLNGKGNSFIIDSGGSKIAHDDRSLVYGRDNDFVNVMANPGLEKLVELEKKMISGLSGTGEYEYNGVKKYMGFCPIGDTGWSLAVAAPKNEVLRLLNIVFIILLVMTLLASLLITWLSSSSKTLKNSLTRQQVNSTRVADVTNLIVFTLDMDGNIETKNKYAEKFFDRFKRNRNEKITNIYELLTPYESEKFMDVIVRAQLQNGSANFELALKREGQESFYLYCSLTGDRESTDMEILGLDITERVMSQNILQDSFDELSAVYDELAEKEEGLRNNYNELKQTQEKLKMSENRYQLVIEGSNDAIWDWDAENDKVFYSDKFYELTGYLPSNMGNGWRGFLSLVHAEDMDMAVKEGKDYISGLKPTLRGEIRLRLPNGDFKWFAVKGKAVFDDDGKVIRAAGSFTDINERKTYEQTIRNLAYTDSLTGLPNRASFYNEIKHMTVQYGERNQCALINVDLDDFKYVNDSFSHYMGDLLLVEVGRRLTRIATDDDFIFRLEGDEFVVLVRHFDKEEELEEKIQAVMSAFDESYNISGNSFHITVSCGVSIYPDHADSIEDMLKNSDLAMYQAKKDGKHKYVIFEKHMNEEFLKRINMENGLRSAIANNEFTLYYQPQYEITSAKITGLEALIRWIHPQHGMIPPLEFIGVAEETGLIVPIGRWVLLTACGFIKQLNDALYTDLEIAVNVSVTQLLQADFVQVVREVLDETGLDPRHLELELTESKLIEAVDLNLQKLTELRELGVKISIDDFGKGFSSLSYLNHLPINSLKIDKSFVDDIKNEGNSMIESIIHIGHQRGLVVIAEGVEKKEQMDYLAYCNCDRVQGYYYSRPVPEDAVSRLLQ